MTQPVPTTMSDAELERLKELLDANEDFMQPDELHGFLCAIHSAPVIQPEQEWLPVIFDVDGVDSEEITALIRRLRDTTIATMEDGQSPRLIGFIDENGHNLSSWCEGYLRGIECSSRDWFDKKFVTKEEKDMINNLLCPFFVVSGFMSEIVQEDSEPWCEDEDLWQLEEECSNLLPMSVFVLYHFWKDKRASCKAHRQSHESKPRKSKKR